MVACEVGEFFGKWQVGEEFVHVLVALLHADRIVRRAAQAEQGVQVGLLYVEMYLVLGIADTSDIERTEDGREFHLENRFAGLGAA